VSEIWNEFEKLSLPRFALLGAAVGLGYFVMIGVNGAFSSWTSSDAITNLAFLTLMGAGSGAGLLVLARRTAPSSLSAGDESPQLTEGAVDVRAQSREKVGERFP
jgi:hypothetical protein